jgi:hypothetical protein
VRRAGNALGGVGLGVADVEVPGVVDHGVELPGVVDDGLDLRVARVLGLDIQVDDPQVHAVALGVVEQFPGETGVVPMGFALLAYTVWPAVASAVAVRLPIPVAAPVIRTTDGMACSWLVNERSGRDSGAMPAVR